MAIQINALAGWLRGIGGALLIAAILWWLAYYGQWGGWFGLLDVKIGCLVRETLACLNSREFIGQSAIPVYSPIIWWAGFISLVVGWLTGRRAKPAT